MSIAEVVCELMYAGKTRNEIAGYDDAFLRWVLCRPRDDCGRLVRHDPDLPHWVSENLDSSGHWNIRHTEPYGVMYRQVLAQQGLSEEQQQETWGKFMEANPKFGVGGE